MFNSIIYVQMFNYYSIKTTLKSLGSQRERRRELGTVWIKLGPVLERLEKIQINSTLNKITWEGNKLWESCMTLMEISCRLVNLMYFIVRSNLAIHRSDTPFIIWQPIHRPRLLERVYKPICTPH